MTIHILSAGSFRAALADLAAAWQGDPITSRCGPAGLLREAIENGEACDLYLSANAENVAKLARRLPLRGCATIARNRLILTCRDSAQTRGRDALQLLLDDSLRLATSTPQADPGGDYAWQVFDRIDALHPVAGDKLKARALQLVGGRTPGIAIPPGIPAAAFLITHDHADISLGYAHYAAQLARITGLRVVPLPDDIAVTAHYTAASLSAPADAFLAWLTTPPAQTIIRRHGFLPPDGQE